METFSEYLPDIINLVDSLRKGHLAIFCGAGATADETNTTWTDLFKEELKVIDKDVKDYYRLAEYYKLHFGRSKLINSVTSIFSEYKSSKHIDHLLKLPVYEFWTTNFDNIIENMIKDKLGITPSVIYNSGNIIKINENKRYKVFKLNGSITDSDSMVLTLSDYESYQYKQVLFLEFLKRELILNTFIFIGYSFEDKLVLNCLHEIKQVFPTLDHYHYRFTKKNKKNPIFQKTEQKFFEDNYNIKTIFIDEYEQIDEFIDNIYMKYISKNIFISGSFRNLSREEEDAANNLCKAIVNKLIDEGFNIYSGDGKRLGSYIISNATIKLMKLNVFDQSRLVIMPWIDHTFKGKNAYDDSRIKIINKMIKDCSASIFLYGQSEDGDISHGVLADYKEAKKKDMITIPIPTTGYAANHIFKEIINNNVPGYLERYIDLLAKEHDPDKIANTILEILKGVELNNNPN